ncbi:sugar phosphate isomerase/epimerase [Dyadobacter sp. CY327]|uniref:DUF6528 family protein n=1 Tax=Dyadobacter sp. CY327 TaxID=2907301 RepID=UPI001F416395|nr:DUF6528 family protein [Dyadobacter sp. CY327]MCE7070132.1 sugar phosphate isomerase/epimerase [Dyadobacter sp. CY327]
MGSGLLGMKCLVMLTVFAAGYLSQPCLAQGKKIIPESWKLGTASGLFPDLTPETLKEVKASGIEHIEVNWKPELVNGTPAERLAFAKNFHRDAKKAGLVIWSTHIPYGKKFDLAETDPQKRPDILRNAKEYIDLAMEMKVKQIVIHPSTEPIPDSERAAKIAACRESLKELSVYSKKKGASLNIECLPRTCLGNTSKEILQILDGIDNIGICFDSNHLLKETPQDFVKAVNKRIRTVHISDYDNVNERHWLPGKGIIDWNNVISALVEVGYKGSFMYEAVKKADNNYSFKDLKPNYESLKKAWINQEYAQSIPPKSFLVCGDSKILIVDYNKSRDSIPEIIWSWDAHLAKDLPETFRNRKFNSTDDCKAINDGKQILISSSSGAIAILNVSDKKVVFYAEVPNAHSVAILPGNKIAAAASTHANGNKIMLFDIKKPNEPLFTDSLYSAHGVVWDAKRKSLFALGFDVLREYKLVNGKSLSLNAHWKIPGEGGHELGLTSDENALFVTEHTGAWTFNLNDHQFTKISGFPDAENIKSLNRDSAGQYIFTIPEKSWWTYHVRFLAPERSFAFPDMKVYKARWFYQ